MKIRIFIKKINTTLAVFGYDFLAETVSMDIILIARS